MSIFSEIVSWCEENSLMFCEIKFRNYYLTHSPAVFVRVKMPEKRAFYKEYRYNTSHTRQLLTKAWRRFVAEYEEKV